MKETHKNYPPIKRARAKLNDEGLHVTLTAERIIETWKALPLYTRLKFFMLICSSVIKRKGYSAHAKIGVALVFSTGIASNIFRVFFDSTTISMFHVFLVVAYIGALFYIVYYAPPRA